MLTFRQPEDASGSVAHSNGGAGGSHQSAAPTMGTNVLLTALRDAGFPPLEALVSGQVADGFAGRLRAGVSVPPVFVSAEGVPWHGFEVLAGAVRAGWDSVSVCTVEPSADFGMPLTSSEHASRGLVVAELTGGAVRMPPGSRVKSWNRFLRLQGWAADAAVDQATRAAAADLCARYDTTRLVPNGEYRAIERAVKAGQPLTVVVELDGLDMPLVETAKSSAFKAAAEMWRLLFAVENLAPKLGQLEPGTVEPMVETLRRVVATLTAGGVR